jgi:hypothetical protein
MSPTQRRIAGSVILAAAFMVWFGGATLESDHGGPVIRASVLLLLSIVVYRAWPAVEIVRERWRTAQGPGGWRPTPRRLLGTAVGAALWTAAFLSFFRLRRPNLTFDAGDVMRALLFPAVICYVWWPQFERNWERLRSG